MKNAIYEMLDDVKTLQFTFNNIFNNNKEGNTVDNINSVLLTTMKVECGFANDMKFSRFKDMDGSRYIVRLESKHKSDIHALDIYFSTEFFPSDFSPNEEDELDYLDYEIEVF